MRAPRAFSLALHSAIFFQTLRFKTRKKGLLTLHKVAAESYAMTLPAAAQTSFELDPALAHSLNLTVLEAYEGSFLTLVLPDAQGVASYQPDFTAIKALGKELIITAAGGTTQSRAAEAMAPGSRDQTLRLP